MPRKRKPSTQTVRVLGALMLDARRWQHGYELAKLTGLKSGTLYPILKRLSSRGFLESHWRDSTQPGRPPRQMYRLTSSGLAVARDLVPHKPRLSPLKALASSSE